MNSYARASTLADGSRTKPSPHNGSLTLSIAEKSTVGNCSCSSGVSSRLQQRVMQKSIRAACTRMCVRGYYFMHDHILVHHQTATLFSARAGMDLTVSDLLQVNANSFCLSAVQMPHRTGTTNLQAASLVMYCTILRYTYRSDAGRLAHAAAHWLAPSQADR
jgi:hypothetical protein